MDSSFGDSSEELLTRYRKKKKKKVPKKIDHVHEPAYCVYLAKDEVPVYGTNTKLHITKYCTICGKRIGKYGDLEKDGWVYNTAQRPWISMDWTDKAKRELNPETRTLPYFEVASFFSKYFDLTQINK